jgi:hypothetical protein
MISAASKSLVCWTSSNVSSSGCWRASSQTYSSTWQQLRAIGFEQRALRERLYQRQLVSGPYGFFGRDLHQPAHELAHQPRRHTSLLTQRCANHDQAACLRDQACFREQARLAGADLAGHPDRAALTLLGFGDGIGELRALARTTE